MTTPDEEQQKGKQEDLETDAATVHDLDAEDENAEEVRGGGRLDSCPHSVVG